MIEQDKLREKIDKLLEITCLTGDEPDIVDQILAKIREVVEGAGLTDEEIKDALDSITLTFYEKRVAQAQLQAILKAIGGRNESR